MIKQMGPLRSYSCRPSERAIRGLTNMIHSPSRPGVNASNNLLNRRTMESYAFNELLHEYTHDSTHAVRSDSFLPNPCGDPDAPQLWDPQSQSQTLGDFLSVADLAGESVKKALKSYYRRLFPSSNNLYLDTDEVQLAERLWSDRDVYYSVLYLRKHCMTTRADNFVLFESGKPGR